MGSKPLPANCETGTYAGKVPFVKWNAGPRKIIVLESSGDLLRGLGKDPMGHVKMYRSMMVPAGFSFIDLGFNPNASPGYTMEEVCADFADCIEHEWEPAPVISGSYGGYLAITLAALYPQLCTKLILVSTAYKNSAWGLDFQNKVIDLAKRGRCTKPNAWEMESQSAKS